MKRWRHFNFLSPYFFGKFVCHSHLFINQLNAWKSFFILREMDVATFLYLDFSSVTLMSGSCVLVSGDIYCHFE